MATRPDIPAPDRIEPAAPPETPATPDPSETPFREPDEITPPTPDRDNPGTQPLETPPPPD
ncbi:hypothetical protein [uncultured Croceicoccus sp.]|uniref:hypothetical protein n=1 Tax=uncultured Croceicoccus sp. TaxID=1295329 RepID=UPI002617FA06|nr:hypothetical protein [uncultured Croceicoccus sp.]